MLKLGIGIRQWSEPSSSVDAWAGNETRTSLTRFLSSLGQESICEEEAAGLPVGLLIGPGPDNRQLPALAIQRADHAPKPQEENDQANKTPETQQDTGPKELDKRQDNLQSKAEEEYKGVEYDGLPGVKSNVRPFVVASYCQKEERRAGGQVCDCANRIVRQTGLLGIRHDPSFFGI
jgi:hypothetical protein